MIVGRVADSIFLYISGFGARTENYGYALPDSCITSWIGKLYDRDDVHGYILFFACKSCVSTVVFGIHVYGSLGAFLHQKRGQGRGASKEGGRERVQLIWTRPVLFLAIGYHSWKIHGDYGIHSLVAPEGQFGTN